METARPYFIAIDGRSGAGKSTLASALARHLAPHATVSILRLEDFYPGWDGLDQAIELYTSVLPDLARGESIHWPGWDWENSTPGAQKTFTPARVVIIEGVGAVSAAARTWLDFSIWLEADPEQRKHRALKRDGQSYAPHWNRWALQEERYLAAHHPQAAADLLICAPDPESSDPLTNLLGVAQYLPTALRELLGTEAPGHRLPLRDNRAAPDDVAAFFEHLAAGLPHAALLESTSHHLADPLERNKYSLIALATTASYPLLQTTAGTTTVRLGQATLRLGAGFFESLGSLWPTENPRTDQYPVPAWVGYLGYELKSEVGAAPHLASAGFESSRPDAQFFAPSVVVVIEHQTGRMAIHAHADQAGWINDRLPHALAAQRTSQSLPTLDFHCADTAAQYKDKIRRAQHQIYEGNTYEVCLTTELTAQVASYHPFEAYCRMRHSSPAPFANYLRLGPLEVASTSPERFLSLSATGALRAEPIKGTRPRGTTPELDAALISDLATSTKDRAENIMIVDLLRNDLSHHALPGSVKVSRLCDIESYATVHQMVSTIDAQLGDRRLAAQALRQAFPPGSMTGAPKLSTMLILDELEDQRTRGLYSGAVGYLAADGSADFSVVIRTLVCDQNDDDSWTLSLGLGGAITADSDPQEEWDEVITKSVGVLSALGSVFPTDPVNIF